MAYAGGADSVWVPDHHIGLIPRSLWTPRYSALARLVKHPDGFLESFALLGHLSARRGMRRFRLGVGVTDPGRRNPAVIAQAFATLHLLTRGRAMLGLGSGLRENTVPFGIDFSKPVGRLEECLGVIRALWESNGRPVDRPGEHFPLRDAVFDLPAYKGTRPPIYVGATGPRMLRIAGRYADGWMPDLVETANEYGERLSAVRDAATEAGRDPRSIIGSGWFFTVTAPTRAMVEDTLDSPLARAYALTLPGRLWARHGAEHPLGADFSGIRDLMPHLISEEVALSYADRVPAGLLAEATFAGTPSELIERFAAYRDQGLGHPVLQHAGPLLRSRWATPMTAAMVRLMRGLRRL